MAWLNPETVKLFAVENRRGFERNVGFIPVTNWLRLWWGDKKKENHLVNVSFILILSKTKFLEYSRCLSNEEK